MKRLVLLFLFTCFAWPTGAANFIVLKNTIGQHVERFDVALEGNIVRGDLAKLKRLLEPINAEGRMEYDGRVRLFLNSEGGNYVEGLEIGDYVRKEGISTRVIGGDVCLSACALVFMHGVARDPDGGEYLDRKMQAGARIGFHAPYLMLPPDLELSGGTARGAVEYAYSEALRAFSRLLESGDKVLSTDLLIKMLRTPPAEMTYVDTYSDLMMWKISLVDAPKLTTIRYEQMIMACENAWAQEEGRRGAVTFKTIREIYKNMKPKLLKILPDGGEWYQFVTDEYSMATCNLKIKNGKDVLDVRLLGFSYADETMPLDTSQGEILSWEYFQDPSANIEPTLALAQ